MLLWLGFLTKERSRRYGMSGQRRRSGWRKGRLTVALVAAMIAMGALTAARAVAAEPPYLDPTQPVPVRVADLLGRMSLDEKIGQMTQAERLAVSGADITNSRLGSLLSGGGSAPSPNSPSAWAGPPRRRSPAPDPTGTSRRACAWCATTAGDARTSRTARTRRSAAR